MTADRIADALDLLARAVETHDGAPADTNLARAQVLATIAVAEQLAKLTQAVAAQHGPPAPATGGQAETAPEKTPAPRLMRGDVWRDDQGERRLIVQGGVPGLTLSGGWVAWEEANRDWGPLTLVRRAGYRRTTDTAPAEQLRRRMVVSYHHWCDGAPVRLLTIAGGVRSEIEVTYQVLGGDGGDIGTGTAAPDARITLWDEIAGGAR